jgi:hypothetical protein
VTSLFSRAIGPLAATAWIGLSGCGLLGPEQHDFVVQIDSVGGPSIISGSSSSQQFFYGSLGPDGCYQFKEFRMTRVATGADISVIGVHTTGQNCTQAPVSLQGQPLTITPPSTTPFIMRIHQRDGTILTKALQSE